ADEEDQNQESSDKITGSSRTEITERVHPVILSELSSESALIRALILRHPRSVFLTSSPLAFHHRHDLRGDLVGDPLPGGAVRLPEVDPHPAPPPPSLPPPPPPPPPPR